MGTKEEKAAKEAKAKEEKAAKAKPPFYIKAGKAITTKKGVKSDGDEIKPEWIGGGKKTFDDLIKKGFIGKN